MLIGAGLGTTVYASNPTPLTFAQQHQQASHPVTVADPLHVLKQAKIALEAATKVKNAPQTAVAQLQLGRALEGLHRYDEAEPHFAAALRYYVRTRNSDKAATVRYALGSAQFSQGDTGKARETYLLALKSFTVLQNLAGVAHGHELLGHLYTSEAKWPQALKNHEQALVAWQKAGNEYQTVVAMNNMAHVHRQQRHYSRALYHLQRAYRKALEYQDSACTGQTLASIGQVYQAMNNQEVAMGFYTQALTNLPPTTAPGYTADLLHCLATAHDSIGNHERASAYLKQALPLARQAGALSRVSSIYQSLSNLYQRDNQYSLSLDALRHYAELQDSVFAEQRSAQVAELQTRYETEKKEREIQLLTKDRQIQASQLRRQQLLRDVLLTGTAVLIVLAGVLYRSRRRHRRLNSLLQQQNVDIQAQRDELGQLNRTKNTLFSVISHDLRSPLGSLYSMLSLLNMGALPPERLAVHSERLSRMLDTTLSLLDNLLNWSAAQMGGEATRPEPVYLDEAVEETLSLLLSDAERKGIYLLNHVEEPCVVHADLNMIRLVLRNLVANAIKFTPAAGTVTVAAQPLGTMWEITVTDSGMGISTTDREKIFGQGGPHTTLGTAREKGTGLGLLLCKDFVERNGGKLSFESEVGQGSIFRFTLPASTQILGISRNPNVAAG
ncbi:tetratricopeptide repeat-containing sensor histidine kinase [Hymenobacter radiodurans]|uniref:tetratricopeptide repeat-containing sensor histidine kinase n=1 Tax=Hymenobacter radiodurans TaxID=2496028 RepID=UPI001404655C|nr:tetratricopeptide repeat protein [Hymenobacter radiodurans]